MLETLGRRAGRFIGGLLYKKDGLEGIRDALERFFSELERQGIRFEFFSNLGDVLVTRSKCPVYKYFPAWCEKGCLEFIEGFAERYGVKVRRRAKQPEDEYCEFEFSV